METRNTFTIEVITYVCGLRQEEKGSQASPQKLAENVSEIRFNTVKNPSPVSCKLTTKQNKDEIEELI